MSTEKYPEIITYTEEPLTQIAAIRDWIDKVNRIRENDVGDYDNLNNEEEVQEDFNDLSPLSAKGSLITYDGTDNIALPVGTDGQILTSNSTEASGLKWENKSGIIQSVYVERNSSFITSAVIPVDTSIPQQTEGAELFTISITPKLATSKLRITVNTSGAHLTSGTQYYTIALFRDSGANAIGARTVIVGQFLPADNTMIKQVDSTSTASTTFKVRVGTDAGSISVNSGGGGTAYFGSASISSIVVDELI